MTEYVTTADTLFFHKQLIERYGGALAFAMSGRSNHSSPSANGLLRHDHSRGGGAAGKPHSNHPFVDGNKRVAFAVIDVFLRINGYAITAESTAIYDSMMKLFEQRTFDMEHLVPWMREIVEHAASHPD